MRLKKIRNLQLKEIKAFSNWGLSLNGFINNRKGEWWFFAQVLIIILHVISPWPTVAYLNDEYIKLPLFLGIIFIVIGILVSIHSLVSLGESLSPLPSPKKGSILITTGAYKKCRHPLYKSLIFLSIGIALYLVSLKHLLLTLILTILLVGKAKREEKDLYIKYPDYRTYQKNSTAILPIPFLNWKKYNSKQ